MHFVTDVTQLLVTFPRSLRLLPIAVCLSFTAIGSARADQAQWPHVGATARAGTAVGFSELGEDRVSTLGGHLGIGYRFGIVAVEVEIDQVAMLEYLEYQGHNRHRGHMRRYGVVGRLYIPQLRRTLSRQSLMRLYVDAGVGQQAGSWDSGQSFVRRDVSMGGGWVLDHRMRKRSGGLPFRSIGWQLGWRVLGSRMASSNQEAVMLTGCKHGCTAPMPRGAGTDYGLLFTSAMTATW